MDVIKHQPKALEMILVKAGYSLDAIRGTREVRTTVEEPTGVEAAVSRVSRRQARAGMAGVIALGTPLVYETGLSLVLVASVVAFLLLHRVGEMDATPSRQVEVVERPGMTRQEVLARIIQHDEHERMKEEEMEDEARKAKRHTNSKGH